TALSYGATEIAEKYRVPFVVDAGVGDDITQRGFKYTFRTCCTAWDYARTSFDLMQNMIKPKKVGIIVENSLYGQSVGKHLQKLCQDAGLDIVVNEAYDAKTVDFAPIVIKVKQAQPEVLLVAQYINDAIQLTNQLAQQGAKVNAIIGNGAGHTMPDYVRGCSGNAEGVFATGAWAPDIKWPEVPAYVQRYKDKYNDMPEQQGAISYLASWVLFDAIERAGSVEPEKITEALRSTNLSSSISGPIKFNDNGQVSVQPPCMQIQQGRFVTVWPPELAAGQPIYPVPGTK
ncbi:MAG TPA: ABC transporter substrate-binding protein, partial [Firmicutes bacterium]|nr:ABC transporter substrate-binding protein [Bacillota bacterium]